MSSRNGTTPTADQLEADIAQQREDLAETIDALQAKLDVKARAKDGLTTDSGKPRPQVLAAAGLAIAAVVGYVVYRRR